MSFTVIMPQIGQDVTTGLIASWEKKENDEIKEGEIVCCVEGDKGVFEIEAEESGVLLKILHQVGEEVEVLKPIGYIGQPGETIN